MNCSSAEYDLVPSVWLPGRVGHGRAIVMCGRGVDGGIREAERSHFALDDKPFSAIMYQMLPVDRRRRVGVQRDGRATSVEAPPTDGTRPCVFGKASRVWWRVPDA